MISCWLDDERRRCLESVSAAYWRSLTMYSRAMSCRQRNTSMASWYLKLSGTESRCSSWRRYKQGLIEVGVFQIGWVTLSANFRWNGTSPTNLFWYQKTRLITLSCDVKISAVCSFVLSQSTLDGQTDGRSSWSNGNIVSIQTVVTASLIQALHQSYNVKRMMLCYVRWISDCWSWYLWHNAVCFASCSHMVCGPSS